MSYKMFANIARAGVIEIDCDIFWINFVNSRLNHLGTPYYNSLIKTILMRGNSPHVYFSEEEKILSQIYSSGNPIVSNSECQPDLGLHYSHRKQSEY